MEYFAWRKIVRTFPFEKERMKGKIINEVQKTKDNTGVSLLRMSGVYSQPWNYKETISISGY